MNKLRLRFEKTGRAVYISHLDLMRTMQRAMLRAELPLEYSEGYNPHALISILMPLSVGTASVCELMDFSLKETVDTDEIPERLNGVFPEGIRALSAYEPMRKPKELKWLRISGELEYDDRDTGKMTDAIGSFFNAPEIFAMKKTKSGEKKLDIAPGVKQLHIGAAEGRVTVSGIFSAAEPVTNPELLVAALELGAPELRPDFHRFIRLETLDTDFEVFR